MAPEQAAGDLDRIDERTDVFALGALLYHVITGAAPYRGDTIDELVAAAKRGQLPRIVEPGLPRELVAICTRATAREPSERYRNARELATALDELGAHALMGKPSRAVNRTFDTMMVAMIPLAIYGVMSAISMSAPITMRNSLHAASIFLLAACGLAASTVEWRTRGRYRLNALSFGFVFATFFVGVGGAGLGLSQTLDAVGPVAADGAKFNALLARGLYESVGELAVAAMLAALQLAMWAVARRSAERSGDRRGAIV